VDGLAHDQVLGIHETKEGVMWFATLGGGATVTAIDAVAVAPSSFALAVIA